MAAFRRVALFVLTNLAVIVLLGIVASVLGVDRFLTQSGLNLPMPLGFAAIPSAPHAASAPRGTNADPAIVANAPTSPSAGFATGRRRCPHRSSFDETASGGAR